jgi:hypothetical protein
MEKPDKKDPNYANKISVLIREFIRNAFTGLIIDRPSIGIPTLSFCITYELESKKIGNIDLRELNRLKTALAKALEIYSEKKEFQRIEKNLLILKDKVAGLKSFDELINIILKCKELMVQI